MNSSGSTDATEQFWQPVFRNCGLDEVPFVVTELGDRVRAYFSAGVIAVRREAGVFREWREDLLRLIKNNHIPTVGIGRMDEVALLAPVVRRYDRARILDGRYNYLIFKRSELMRPLREAQFDQLSHVHYRFAFQQPGFLRLVQPPLDQRCEIVQWLEQYLPLKPLINDPVA